MGKHWCGTAQELGWHMPGLVGWGGNRLKDTTGCVDFLQMSKSRHCIFDSNQRQGNLKISRAKRTEAYCWSQLIEDPTLKVAATEHWMWIFTIFNLNFGWCKKFNLIVKTIKNQIFRWWLALIWLVGGKKHYGNPLNPLPPSKPLESLVRRRVATEQGLLPFDWVALAWLRHWGKILLDSHHIHHVFDSKRTKRGQHMAMSQTLAPLGTPK